MGVAMTIRLPYPKTRMNQGLPRPFRADWKRERRREIVGIARYIRVTVTAFLFVMAGVLQFNAAWIRRKPQRCAGGRSQ